MHSDALVEAHKEWLGYVQPVGLLVAPAALVHRGIVPDRNVAALQERLDAITRADADAEPIVFDFAEFATSFFGWDHRDLAGASGGPLLPDELAAELIEFAERLTPTYAVPAAENAEGAWQMLIRVETPGTEFDQAITDDGKHWAVSPHARFERLLRETDIPIGLLTNGRSFRLIYAPKGETSGFATFDLESMLEVSGRPMLSAFHMLLKVERLFGSPEQNLPGLLAESRDYQETVSKELADQVLVALNELLRGFHAADLRTHRGTIVDLIRSDPNHLYSGLLTALLRLVFVLYAEDRDLFPRNEIWERNYSLGGLFERLRRDDALYPDTMDDRYGAWAQLLALWRLMYFGGRHAGFRLVPRRGQLFDPSRFPFMEGRSSAEEPIHVPAVSDGVIWRVLRALMVLNGERLSYRTLDVEQLGSVYQSVMGFTVDVTTGPSLAIRPAKRSGASATIDLVELLGQNPVKRPEWVRQRTDRKFTPKVASAVAASKTISELETVLAAFVDTRITAKSLPAGIPVLQPTESRRRTGSHYTPRRLTAPVVAETLRPILERLGDDATGDEILRLRIVDPALGSGAFLVEACRQIAERLVQAWERHRTMPALPSDEDSLLHARRLVAQRCLYGVDRNPMATDLAKLSLWLVTLAREHEFTFLDHAIRHGDALVGLSLKQIEGVNWSPSSQLPLVSALVREQLKVAVANRNEIKTATDDAPEIELKELLANATSSLADLQLIGDALVYAFFAADKAKDRERHRQNIVTALDFSDRQWIYRLRDAIKTLRAKVTSLSVFHWDLEFPEVFIGSNPGFDAIVGNPPYAGKATLSTANPERYIAWLKVLHEQAHGNADLVSHFFRRGFTLIRVGGSLGFIATNTIRQGDTRATGLRWIRHHHGIIYAARRRFRWPGEAAVVVSVVYLAKGSYTGSITLDGRNVDKITAYLFDQGGDDDPVRLATNANLSFVGSYPLGMGFTFDDTDKKGVASPIAVMNELILRNPRNAEHIKPYIGGEEVQTDPAQRHHRYIIQFDELDEAQARGWPDLWAILEERVKPFRATKDVKKYPRMVREWWKFWNNRRDLARAIQGLRRVLVKSQTASRFAFTFLDNDMIYDQKLVVFALDTFAAFAVLQSRVHEVWAVFFGSSLKDDPVYTSSDVFETFPFPMQWTTDGRLEEVGRRYFDCRAELMISNREGLTDTYNRFHDPTDVSRNVQRLRDLHGELDRAVLDVFGWSDISAVASFEPDWTDDSGIGPLRYAWSTETHDLILGRLLQLNGERGREEARLGVGRVDKQYLNGDREDEESETFAS